MDNDLVGKRYVATDGRSTEWEVIAKVVKGMKVPHVRLLRSGEPGVTKLIAVNALMDEMLYRRVE